MAKYHVNPNTGRPNLCGAEEGNCPYKNEDGSPAPHFETKTEARAYNEKEMSKEYGASSGTISKKKHNSFTEAEIAVNKKKIQKIEKEIEQLREMKKGSNPDEIKKINGIIRGKSINLTKLKRETISLEKTGMTPESAALKAAAEKTKKTSANIEKPAVKDTPKPPKNIPKATFEEPGVKQIEGYMGNKGWAGNKVTKGYTPLKEIAKNIRNDLKQAEAAGYLPKGYKYSVKTRNHNAIDIEINGMPKDSEKYNYNIRQTSYGYHFYEVHTELKPEYKDVVEKVQAISNSYNYDTSNSMVDYFNKGFYGSVKVPDDSAVAWNRAEAAERKVKRIANGFKKDGFTKEEIAKKPEFIKAREDYYKLAREYKIESIRSNALYEIARTTGRIDDASIRALTQKRLAEHDAKYGKTKRL